MHFVTWCHMAREHKVSIILVLEPLGAVQALLKEVRETTGENPWATSWVSLSDKKPRARALF